ncbi:MAG: hypothetical protein HRF50_17610 [Phycisphaerae bacterium]
MLALLAAACDRQPGREAPAPPNAGDPPPAASDPQEFIEELLAARRAGSYRRIEQLVVSERAAEVVATLRAVDEFLVANRGLCEYVREHVNPGVATWIDQAYLGGSLEVFSSDVRILSSHEGPDQAEVSFLVDERLPARHARLVRDGGTWRYDPGPGYDGALPRAFAKMADGLRQLLDDLRSGRVSADEVRRNPQRLLDELKLRLSPGVRMLPRPPESSQPSGG